MLGEVINFLMMTAMSIGIIGGVYFAYIKESPVLAALSLVFAFLIAVLNVYCEVVIDKEEKKHKKTTHDFTANKRFAGKTWR